MSQHITYQIPGQRAPQVSYENASSRGILSRELDTRRLQAVPMDINVPMRAQYTLSEAQLSGGPRVTQVPYEVQDHRGTHLELGRPDTNTAEVSVSGHSRVHQDNYTDAQRTEFDQSRQQRMLPVDTYTRYAQHDFEPSNWTMYPQGQVSSYDHIGPDLVVDQISNSQSGQIVPNQLILGSSFAMGSPRSGSSRKPTPPSAQTSPQSNSNDNLSTATTAVESGSDLDILSTLNRIASTLAKVQEDQITLLKKMQAIDTATATRLSDFRDHVDKKFDRYERNMETAFDDLWGAILENKRVRDIISGGHATETILNDEEINIAPKRRRWEE